MVSFKKLLLLFVILLCFYILYKLVVEREKIMKQYEQSMKDSAISILTSTSNKIEGFGTIPHIASTKTVTFPLKEYVFMSSWNSAVDEGQNVTLDALEKTIVRGYRFLDLEIYLVNDQPHVGFSTLKNYNTMDTTPLILFDALGLIMTKAFSVDNGKDPLFIHLRIKSLKMDIFTKLADAISLQLGSRLHKGEVTKDTLLSEIQNKIVIVVDKTYIPHINKYECKDGCKNNFMDIINMYSGTNELSSMKVYQQLEQPSQPLQLTNDQRTNVKKLRMVTAGIGEFYDKKNNPDFYKLVKNHSIQIVPMKVSSKDEAFDKYEAFFKNNGNRAFVPMAIALSYIELETES